MQDLPKFRTFFVVVRDEDRKLFSVHGPVTNDKLIRDRAAEARSGGRNIVVTTSQCSNRLAATQEAAHAADFLEADAAF